jgi:hypothetical protein
MIKTMFNLRFTTFKKTGHGFGNLRGSLKIERQGRDMGWKNAEG